MIRKISLTDGIWSERLALCNKILRELLGEEFSGIEKEITLTIGPIESKEFQMTRNATVLISSGVITINESYWDRFDYSEERLRQTLRHELLHVETGRGDDDPIFRAEAEKRGIGLNVPADGVCELCSQCLRDCKKYEIEAVWQCSDFLEIDWNYRAWVEMALNKGEKK